MPAGFEIGPEDVRAAAERAEHPPGVLVVAGLSERRPVEDDDRVRREDDGARGRRGRHGRGLGAGEPLRGIVGVLARENRLVHVGRADLGLEPEGAEEVEAARRGRGEEETGSAHGGAVYG